MIDANQQLAGLHSNAYINDKFARAFAKEGMKAYVELIQRKERDIGCDVLTHQKVRRLLDVSYGPSR
jgi:isocitrate lyase